MPFTCCLREIEKHYGYRDGVLIGNWVDVREGLREKSPIIFPTPLTVYRQDYKPFFKPLDRVEMCRNMKNGWGNPLSCNPDEAEDRDKYCDCFVTLNDIVYHHHVKENLNDDFGNLTRTGLCEKKNRQWTEQKRNNTYETLYNTSYQHYPRECLQTEHIREHRCLKKGHNHKRYRMCCFMPHTPRSILPSL